VSNWLEAVKEASGTGLLPLKRGSAVLQNGAGIKRNNEHLIMFYFLKHKISMVSIFMFLNVINLKLEFT